MQEQIYIGNIFRDLFARPVWKRGALYLKESRVRFLGCDPTEQTASFAVIGNGGRYSVSLEASPQIPYGPKLHCDCSSDGLCHHSAAALQYGLDEKILTEEPVQARDFQEILNRFREESRIVSLEDKVDSPPVEPPGEIRKDRQLVFLLRQGSRGYPDFAPFLEISWAERILKKDGSPGRITEKPEEGSIPGSTPNEQNFLRLLRHLPPEDRSLLSLLPDVQEMENPSVLMKDGNDFSEVRFLSVSAIHLDFEPARLEEEWLFRPRLELNGNRIELEDSWQWEFDRMNGILFSYSGPDLYIFQERFSVLRFLNRIFRENLLFTRQEVHSFLRENPSEHIQMDVQLGTLEERKILPRLKIYLRPDGKRTEVHPFLVYGNREVNFSSLRPSVLDESDGRRVLYVRDNHLEKALILSQLNLQRGEVFVDDPLILNLTVREFLLQKAPSIMENGGEILYKDGKKTLQKEPLKFSLSSGIDWLDVRLSVGGRNFPLPVNLPASGILEYEGGFKVLSQKELDKLERLQARALDSSGDIKAVSYDLDLLSVLDEDLEETDDLRLQRMTEAVRRLKKGFSQVDFSLPEGLNAELRPYQVEGFQWLCFLFQYRLGGILADDMGLGKTVQTISLLLHAFEQKSSKPFLVVAPVSTLDNWRSEIRRFAPDLRPHFYLGSDRKDWNSAPGVVVLTSYQTLLRDLEFFSLEEWEVVVLDESQALKNHLSKTSKAVRSLNGRRFLALSGTPLENHIGELWAIMNLLNPGLLGSHKGFLRRYRGAFQRNEEQRIEELKSRIAPFLLRRRKQDVAKDLPPKEEIMLTVSLSAEEKAFYEKQKAVHIAEMQRLKQDKAPAFQISTVMLKALNSLRQTAISPELKGGPQDSTKLDVAVEKILEAAEEDHKVLVFSQFVRVLDLLKTRLDTHHILYENLDGSMTAKRRQAAVRNFQQNEEVKAFLISLKAGGTGLNLVEADYVIILDPWWNPAIESQAIDRSHRIGQTRPVTAYKIIARDTVEEKVLELQKQKQVLADELLEGASSPLQSLSADEILKLF